ncbi:MAG: GNAT family N-acetyltransferase [Paraclostridium sp.]|uniref:GNAT family N-acetyltransferase n=1 Tax=Paraclostridium sp. TaxID=2023273 RepID=UPI003F39BEB5
MEIKIIKYGDELWNSVIDYASNCSWRAGASLARKMKERIFTDWESVIIATDGEKICGYCTLTKTDCIPELAYTPYIGYMFVDEKYRGHRLSEKLINKALEYAKTLEFEKVYLVSGEKGLYEKYGFVKIEEDKSYCRDDEHIFELCI